MRDLSGGQPLREQCLPDGVHLKLRVWFRRAVEETDLGGVRYEVEDHLRLFIERGKVGGSRNVPADSPIEVFESERRRVVRHGGAEDGDFHGDVRGGLQSGGGIRQDQIVVFGYEGVGDGVAGIGVARRVLYVDRDIFFAQFRFQCVAEAARRRVECVMLRKLEHAYRVAGFAAAGAKRERRTEEKQAG